MTARHESHVRAILGLGVPMLVGAVAATMSGVIDIAMIGHYGARDVVAVAAATTVFDIFANVVLASIMGHQILSARFAGRDEPGGIRDSVRATLGFSGGWALGCALLCALVGPCCQIRVHAALVKILCRCVVRVLSGGFPVSQAS